MIEFFKTLFPQKSIGGEEIFARKTHVFSIFSNILSLQIKFVDLKTLENIVVYIESIPHFDSAHLDHSIIFYVSLKIKNPKFEIVKISSPPNPHLRN